jgi:hypothetical protein
MLKIWDLELFLNISFEYYSQPRAVNGYQTGFAFYSFVNIIHKNRQNKENSFTYRTEL